MNIPKTIFISYRRNDSAAMAGRIKDRIKAFCPKVFIFIDVEAIEGGAVFEDVINNAITRSEIFICLIGKEWMGPPDNNRMMDVDDFVRKEVEIGLNAGSKFYPILIDNASMPDGYQLPPGMRPLCKKNAMELRHSSFENDMNNLLKTVFGYDPTLKLSKKMNIFRSALLGIPIGLVLLVVLAHFIFSVTNVSLKQSLGIELTVIFLVGIPALTVFAVYRLLNR